MGKRMAASAVVWGLALSLAACGSSKSPTASTSTTSQPETLPTPAPGVTFPSNVPNQVGVRKDVSLVSCAVAPGGWGAGGTIDNKLGRAATFDITVFFTSVEATDLSSATTNVHVRAGQTAPWSVRATFPAPSRVICVLRGVAAR